MTATCYLCEYGGDPGENVHGYLLPVIGGPQRLVCLGCLDLEMKKLGLMCLDIDIRDQGWDYNYGTGRKPA